MKAEDLMINDLVQYGSPVIVTEIMLRDRYAIIGINKHGEHEQVLDNELSPIPLTPEILERNEFMQLEGSEKEDSVFYALSDMFAKVRWNGEKITDAVFGENILYFPGKRGLRYVHELQHALRLCGIEKEIIL